MTTTSNTQFNNGWLAILAGVVAVLVYLAAVALLTGAGRNLPEGGDVIMGLAALAALPMFVGVSLWRYGGGPGATTGIQAALATLSSMIGLAVFTFSHAETGKWTYMLLLTGWWAPALWAQATMGIDPRLTRGQMAAGIAWAVVSLVGSGCLIAASYMGNWNMQWAWIAVPGVFYGFIFHLCQVRRNAEVVRHYPAYYLRVSLIAALVVMVAAFFMAGWKSALWWALVALVGLLTIAAASLMLSIPSGRKSGDLGVVRGSGLEDM